MLEKNEKIKEDEEFIEYAKRNGWIVCLCFVSLFFYIFFYFPSRSILKRVRHPTRIPATGFLNESRPQEVESLCRRRKFNNNQVK